ncbi:TPR-like protein [Mycena galericulata]|nr:TPR-like protein [Mycena galericulata]
MSRFRPHHQVGSPPCHRIGQDLGFNYTNGYKAIESNSCSSKGTHDVLPVKHTWHRREEPVGIWQITIWHESRSDGKESGAIQYRWSHAFTAPCSHFGAAWTSVIYKINFLAFKLLDLSLTTMSGLEKVIQLHSIRVTSLTNPHDDLPSDMKMSTQVIIEDFIFLQTLPVGSEHDHTSWKLVLGCNIPPHAPTFSVAVLRQSETEGTRLIGYVEIERNEVLESVESKRSFQLQLNKVNRDGPSLNFSAGFSVSELSYQGPSGLDLICIPENRIASGKGRSIASEMNKMDEAFRKNQLSLDAPQCQIMHERLLFCKSDETRAQWLHILGDILSQSYQGSGTVDDLNQAVCAYHDAVRDDPGPVTYLSDLGRCLHLRFQRLGNLLDLNRSVVILEAAVVHSGQDDRCKPQLLSELGDSLLKRFERLGDVTDITQCISRFEAAVTLTPDGHPDKPSRLSNLGMSLLSRFKQQGDPEDMQLAVLKLEAAITLTPDGHPDKPSLLNNLGNLLRRRFEQLGGLDDLNHSVLILEAAVNLTPDGHPDRPSPLNNLGSSLLRRFERLGDLPDLELAVLKFEAAVTLTPDGHPGKPSRLNNIGSSLFRRFEQLGDLPDLELAVLRFEAAITLTADGHMDKPSWLSNLGNSLLRRFEKLGDLSDLHSAVLRLEAAVTVTPDGHPDKPSQLNNLGNSLLHRFKKLDNLSDLNLAVLRLEAAVNLTPDGHPVKPSQLNNLGDSLLHRFEKFGNLSDLNLAVLRLEAAVTLTPDGHREKPSLLNKLGNFLLRRFEKLGALSDLHMAVLKFEAGVTLTPDGHTEKPSHLNNLGNSLLQRFERLGGLDDLNQSVLRFEAAATLTPDGHLDKPAELSNLGISLRHRFERLGGLDDLNQSVLRLEAAVNLTPDGHPAKPSQLTNLGSSLLRLFERLGDLPDLESAVLRFEAAITLTPDGHPDKASCLSGLGTSLLSRFKQLGELPDLQLAVLKLEAAVMLIPDDHLNKPSLLNNLAICLICRFEQLGGLDDLNQSVLRSEAAVTLTPDGDTEKPSRLINLGNSLRHRFERLGDLDDLNQSVLGLKAALSLTPDGHPAKPALLNNLGISLRHRFEELGGLDDLNYSVSRLITAVTLSPDDHPDKPSRLNNLGDSLCRRFIRLGFLPDLQLAVLMFEAAVTLTPDGHPAKPLLLNNLGDALCNRFELLHDPQDSQKLLLHYTSAACSTTGPASQRFYAAKRWATNARIHQPSSILQAYTTAIELLPELAWLGLSIPDRHHHLLLAGEVVRAAASAAIAVQDYQTAVEWLDQGRSVIWGQLLNLRTPVDELRTSHPVLANELISLSTSLEAAGTQGNAVADAGKAQWPQSIVQQSHDLALKRNLILQQIRELPGFNRFLLSKPISELMLAANRGPVAILNTSEYRCDALILMPGLTDEIMHVPLSNFTMHEAQALAESLASVVGTSGRSDRLHGFREGDRAPDDVFSEILSEVWLKIVQPIVNGIGITTPVGQHLGRIWWCPTGPLAFLPIHAAGLYGEDRAVGSKLSDFLISSYTPSLSALIQGFHPQPESKEDLQLLAVTQPSADGHEYIPGTRKEIKCIQHHARGKVTIQWLDEKMATIDNVQKGMKNSRWVHFACHGVQSAAPTESALLLAESSRLTLSNIIQLSLPNADLAFLSACQTATGSKMLQDESVHLAAGMLLAGYRGVIGTMWSIRDNDAPQVASDVYAHLLEVSPPDPTRAAEALHLAVGKLREQLGSKKSFLHWVPFIHFGV